MGRQLVPSRLPAGAARGRDAGAGDEEDQRPLERRPGAAAAGPVGGAERAAVDGEGRG